MSLNLQTDRDAAWTFDAPFTLCGIVTNISTTSIQLSQCKSQVTMSHNVIGARSRRVASRLNTRTLFVGFRQVLHTGRELSLKSHQLLWIFYHTHTSMLQIMSEQA